MFSRGTTKNGETMVANRINEGTVISGDISAQTDIRLDGTIMGNIICSSKVVIGSNAHITGHITCNDLTIEGRVDGNLEVNGTLFFRSEAVFDGDVKYKKLIVEEGANITGSLVNTNAVTKPLQQTSHHGETNTPYQQTAG